MGMTEAKVLNVKGFDAHGFRAKNLSKGFLGGFCANDFWYGRLCQGLLAEAEDHAHFNGSHTGTRDRGWRIAGERASRISRRRGT